MHKIGPRRIVCLTEETTELLYLLGEQDRIVGISAYTVRPPEAKKEKPVVSAFLNGSIPKIRDLKPDLVIGFSDIQADLARDLIKEGLNVLILNQRSITEIMDAMRTIGGIVGKNPETQTLINDFEKTIQTIEKARTGREKPSMFFQEWDDPIISGIQWVSELIEISGARDVFSHLNGKMAKDRIVTEDQVQAANPDLIVGSWCGKPVDFEWVYGRPAWQEVSAIRNKKVFEIDSSIILQPGPALFLSGIQTLADIVNRK